MYYVDEECQRGTTTRCRTPACSESFNIDICVGPQGFVICILVEIDVLGMVHPERRPAGHPAPEETAAGAVRKTAANTAVATNTMVGPDATFSSN